MTFTRHYLVSFLICLFQYRNRTIAPSAMCTTASFWLCSKSKAFQSNISKFNSQQSSMWSLLSSWWTSQPLSLDYGGKNTFFEKKVCVSVYNLFVWYWWEEVKKLLGFIKLSPGEKKKKEWIDYNNDGFFFVLKRKKKKKSFNNFNTLLLNNLFMNLLFSVICFNIFLLNFSCCIFKIWYIVVNKYLTSVEIHSYLL